LNYYKTLTSSEPSRNIEERRRRSQASVKVTVTAKFTAKVTEMEATVAANHPVKAVQCVDSTHPASRSPNLDKPLSASQHQLNPRLKSKKYASAVENPVISQKTAFVSLTPTATLSTPSLKMNMTVAVNASRRRTKPVAKAKAAQRLLPHPNVWQWC